MNHEQLCTYDRSPADYGQAEYPQSSFATGFQQQTGLDSRPAARRKRQADQRGHVMTWSGLAQLARAHQTTAKIRQFIMVQQEYGIGTRQLPG